MRSLKLANFLIKRVISIIVVLIGVVTITFVISRILPGDPIALIAGYRAPPAVKERVIAEFGLNQPLYVQYYHYIVGVFTGNLGLSISTQHPVFSDIVTFLPATLELVIPTMLIVIPISVYLGVVAGKSKDRLPDHIARLIALSGFAVPAFWLGILLQFIFAYTLKWLPVTGEISPTIQVPPHVTGIYVIDGLLSGDWSAVESSLVHLVLPVATLSVGFLATLVRLLRSSMIDVLGQDYIRTARASGIPERTINYRYALRNAFLPTATSLGLAFGYLFGGTVLVEVIFDWEGLGLYLNNAILYLDFPAIIGTTFVLAVFVMVINLATDLSYGVIDPRVRYG